MEALRDLIPFLVPLILLQFGLMAVALYDLLRRERVRGGNKLVWGIVIVAINMIGPLIYLMAGREEA